MLLRNYVAWKAIYFYQNLSYTIVILLFVCVLYITATSGLSILICIEIINRIKRRIGKLIGSDLLLRHHVSYFHVYYNLDKLFSVILNTGVIIYSLYLSLSLLPFTLVNFLDLSGLLRVNEWKLTLYHKEERRKYENKTENF